MKWAIIKATAARWLLPAAISLVVVGLGGGWWHGYTTGKKVTQADQLQALEDLRIEAGRLADELEQEKQRERIIYRDRIRTVYGEPDPSGCADVRVPDRVLSAIRGATGQPADGAVRETAPDGRNE